MVYRYVLPLLLLLSVSLQSQVAYITASPSDCTACVDLPLFAFEQLEDRFMGEVKVVMGSPLEDINEIYINSFFGWDSLMSEKYVIQDSLLYSRLSVGDRSGIVIEDCDGEKVYQDLLVKFCERVEIVTDSINNLLVEECLKKYDRVKLDDRRYSFLLNVLLGASSKREFYFFNNSNYLPYVLWKANAGGHVSRYEDISGSQYEKLLSELGLKISFKGGFEKIKKVCYKKRVQVLHVSSAFLRNDTLYCWGEFNFDVTENGELVYVPLFFAFDENFNLIDFWGFDRHLFNSNFFVIYIDGFVGRQSFIKDGELCVKIYDPDYLPGYLSESVEGGNFYTSARFRVGKDSLVFLGYDRFLLHEAQVRAGDYYYNNWSYYIDLDSIIGLIYFSYPNDIFLDKTEVKQYGIKASDYNPEHLQDVAESVELKAYHMGAIEEKWQLSYASSTDDGRILRVVQKGSEYQLLLDTLNGGQTKISLGQINNPAFHYQDGVLYIISMLPGKLIEVRKIGLAP